MRILYCTFDTVPSPKGASTHITYFIRALKRHYGMVRLLSLNNAPCIEYSTYQNIEHIRAGWEADNFLSRVELFRDFVQAHLSQERYDIVHFRSIWEGIPIIEAALKGSFKTIFEVNGLPSIELKYHYPELEQRKSFIDRLKGQEFWCLSHADHVITPSPVTALLIEKACRNRVTVISNGADESIFYPGAACTGKPVILYMGTLAPWQGLPTLLSAFAGLVKSQEAILRILGAGRKGWLKEYRKLSRKLGIEHSVIFEAPVPHQEAASRIRDAHICAAPLEAVDRNTLQGCSPVKLFEYMACAKPIVASDIPAVSSILSHRQDALLFTPGDSSALRDALEQLIADRELRERLSRSAFERVRKEFLWHHAQQKLLEMYDRMDIRQVRDIS